jgi:ABC-type Fe3+-hydroxamate transport system substrate-binding protein
MSWLGFAGGALMIAVLAACGTPAASTSTTIETASPLATTPATADAYPRIVTDTGGRALTFNQRPERVVLATYRNILDELLMLDVTPLAYAAWLEEQLPIWTRQTLDQRGITLTNLNGQAYPAEINFEQLAALQPDSDRHSGERGRHRNNVDQSQAILQWTPLATPFLVETLNELVASYEFETN